jgi:hypothetical protein
LPSSNGDENKDSPWSKRELIKVLSVVNALRFHAKIKP